MFESQKTIAEWGNEKFGKTDDYARIVGRCLEEFAELTAKMGRLSLSVPVRAAAEALKCRGGGEPRAPVKEISEEMADVMILLFRAADALGCNLLSEVVKKMKINRGRKWARGSSPGLGHHLR